MAEVDPSHLLVFERAYAHRQATGSWPTVEELQRELASERINVSVREAVNEARSYASINAPDDQVQLSLRALTLLPAARPVLEAYLRAVRTMISRYRDRSTAARYGQEDLKGLNLEPDVEAELGRLLRDDGWTFGSGGTPNDGLWSFEISDRIMRAADAESVEELVAARFDEPFIREDPSPPPEPITGAPGTSPAVDPDQPISRPQDDLLGRIPLARALAVQATSQPQGHGFVMGVCGAWGSGKTSLLNLMADAIAENESGYVIRFDPWMFSSSEELVMRFLRELSAQMVRERKLGEVASRIADYAQVLAPLTVLSPAPWLAPMVAVSGRASRWWHKKKDAVSAQEQRQRVREALTGLDRRLVVLIDDLDRLQSHELRDIVRLVKLVGDFPNTTYVLAYDQQRVASALGDTVQEGNEFLEKIIQLSHDVPPTPPGALGQVLAGAISAAVGDLSAYRFDQDAYTDLFVAGVRDLFSTVRDVRRYTNVLPATLALVTNEIELADILALEALRVRTPTSFALITASKGALTETRSGASGTGGQVAGMAPQQVAAIVQAAGGFSDQVQSILRRLFPATERYFGGSAYGEEWLGHWRRDRRVAHPEVFDIYLNRALPAGVLPAALVERIFASFGDAAALTLLLSDLDQNQLESVLDRLEEFEDRFPTDHAEIPVSALYNQRGRLRTERRHVFDIGAEHKLGRVALRILRRLEPAEVERVTEAALSEIPSLSDRADLIRLIGHREDSGHQLVSEVAAQRLEDRIVDEVLAADAAILSEERDLLSVLLWTHGSGAEQLDARIGDLIEDDDFLLSLLRGAIRDVVGQAVGGAAVRHSAELNWQALTQLVAKERLAARVKALLAGDLAQLDDRARLALELARSQLDEPLEGQRPPVALS